ncbi:MAG: cache domain-containing sensor histidine kinase [Ruminiclostridium sp.]
MKKIIAVLYNKKLSIRTQLLIYCSLFVLVAFFMVGITFQSIYNSIAVSKVEKSDLQTITSIQSNIYSVISSAGDFSKMILSNNTVQEILSKESDSLSLKDTRQINAVMGGYLNSMTDITSINIFDRYGNHYNQNSMRLERAVLNPKDTDYYNLICDLRGGFIIQYKNNQNLSSNKQVEDGDYSRIVLIRVINSIDTQKPIGTLVINISGKAITRAFAQLEKQEGTGFFLLDQDNNPIYENETRFSDFDYKGFIDMVEKNSTYSTQKVIDGQKCSLSYGYVDQYGWKIIGITSLNNIMGDMHSYSILTLLAVVVFGILILGGMVFISKHITDPIKKLTEEMTNMENGNFHLLRVKIRTREMDELISSYNFMVQKIEALVESVINEQRIKRKAELSVLQEQIKPHFLYNTFDAISALIIMKKYDDAYKAILTLGNYYRVSLSRGKVAITLAEEINLLKNYLFIQKIRYGDLFDVEYELDEELNGIKILKLTLQPFVENAIYHGIKPGERKGFIKIKTFLKEEKICISIEDNGVGMDENVLKSIFDHKSAEDKYFGIRGTCERLEYFYGSGCTVEFSNKIDMGVCVMITIPKDSLNANLGDLLN